MSWDGAHATCAGEKKVAAPHQKRDPGGLKEKAATEKTTADGKPTIIYIYIYMNVNKLREYSICL